LSLIGDALRKTRQEAAERDSDRKGVLFSAKIAERPTRSGLGLGLVLGALIAVIATVAGGGAVWWVLSTATKEAPAAAPSSASESVTDPLSVLDDNENSQGIDPGVELASPSGPTAANVSSIDRKPHQENETAHEQTVKDDTTDRGRDARATTEAAHIDPDSVREAMPPSPASEIETGFVGKEDGADVYLMEANLGDVTLSLDFLVFRSTDSYAEINGTEVHVGGTIEGYRVKSVERDRVVLSDGRKTIVLRAP